MRSAILRAGKQESGAAIQSFKSEPGLDDHQFKQEELESVGEASQVCYACTWHELDDWSVNNLARAVTKWTQACDRR